MIRTVLIDDEPPARRKLRHLLADEADVSVIGEAGSGAQAVELLNREQPDLVFLDIQLPDCTGFDVVESLAASRHAMQLVFVTAHDDFALRAFEVHAIDYLLKPVEPSRFAQSLGLIWRRLQNGAPAASDRRLQALVQTLQAEPAYSRRLLIQEGERSFFLPVNRIDWIVVGAKLCRVHSGGRTYVLRSSLESLAAKLYSTRFRRINRSEIVNVERIAEVRSWSHGDQKIVLTTGEELNWSRRYRTPSLEELERG